MSEGTPKSYTKLGATLQQGYYLAGLNNEFWTLVTPKRFSKEERYLLHEFHYVRTFLLLCFEKNTSKYYFGNLVHL